jgi:hypothetical protein
MKTPLIALFAGVLQLSVSAATEVYDHIMAPPGAGAVEGNSFQIPLDTAEFPARFQQVYASSLFVEYAERISIGGLEFKGDAYLGHGFDRTISDVEIHLSTTSRAVDGLDSSFDLNVGLDDLIVIRRSPFRLTGAGGGGVPGPWSVFLDFRQTPFVYNPALGNLLLDIKVFSGASTAPFDAVDIRGDSISSVFAYDRTFPGVGQPSSLGLATLFLVQPVPEPSSLVVLLFSLAGGWMVVRRRGHRRN